MFLLIQVTPQAIKLKLQEGRRSLASKQLSLGEAKIILREIDNLLRLKNKQITDLEKVKTEIDQRQRYTTARIVKIIAATLNLSLQAGRSR